MQAGCKYYHTVGTCYSNSTYDDDSNGCGYYRTYYSDDDATGWAGYSLQDCEKCFSNSCNFDYVAVPTGPPTALPTVVPTALPTVSTISCNVGYAYQYSGCGSSFADSTSFAETDCGSGYDSCLSYAIMYDSEAAGYTGSYVSSHVSSTPSDARSVEHGG